MPGAAGELNHSSIQLTNVLTHCIAAMLRGLLLCTCIAPLPCNRVHGNLSPNVCCSSLSYGECIHRSVSTPTPAYYAPFLWQLRTWQTCDAINDYRLSFICRRFKLVAGACPYQRLPTMPTWRPFAAACWPGHLNKRSRAASMVLPVRLAAWSTRRYIPWWVSHAHCAVLTHSGCVWMSGARQHYSKAACASCQL